MASKLNLLEAVGFSAVVEVWVPIVVALITGPLVVVANRLRKENSEQHSEARILLRQIGRKVDRVGEKVDSHLGWHKGREDN
tara:strand:+ start:601 stop:846 length:246 start_codon:yes stop_codon:yes gene_type:complete